MLLLRVISSEAQVARPLYLYLTWSPDRAAPRVRPWAGELSAAKGDPGGPDILGSKSFLKDDLGDASLYPTHVPF